MLGPYPDPAAEAASLFIPEWRLRVLQHSPDPWVRQAVAGNARTEAAILTELAEDPDETVRWAVAGNASIPLPVLRMLAEDADSGGSDGSDPYGEGQEPRGRTYRPRTSKCGSGGGVCRYVGAGGCSFRAGS